MASTAALSHATHTNVNMSIVNTLVPQPGRVAWRRSRGDDAKSSCSLTKRPQVVAHSWLGANYGLAASISTSLSHTVGKGIAHHASSNGNGNGNSNGNGDVWHDPVMDALSVADRAVLALARAAASISDKAVAEHAAASHGLMLVTSSEVCVAPLLPAFGSTMEEDGEEGDGMGVAEWPLSRSGNVGSGGLQQRSTLAGGATALYNAVFASRAASTSSTSSSSAASTSATAASLASVSSIRMHAGSNGSSRAHGGSGSSDSGAIDMAHLAAEGGGGDVTDEEDEQLSAGSHTYQSASGSKGGSSNGSSNHTGSGSSMAMASAAAPGLVGAAAAALNRVAMAASGAAADLHAPVAVGRAAAAAAGAATAATAAAAAASAVVAKATAQMLPHQGDPTSTWLVADDAAGAVRYIAIAAGPDLRHRSARELTTDLVTFETYNLGAKINKRLYAEATALYVHFMPLLMDFLEANPQGSICFGGQGVGGSLAVLLQLMCCHRGLRFARLLPAVAVDAPAVLAQVPLSQRRKWGAAGRDQHLHQDQMEDVLEDLMSRTVLEELGLPQEAVRNILISHHAQQAQRAGGNGNGNGNSNGGGSSPVVVMAAAAAAAGAAVTSGNGSGKAAANDPACAQVFRLVGKVVQVDSVASAAARVKAAPEATSATMAPPTSLTALVVTATGGGAAASSIVETDGGAAEVAAVAAAGVGSQKRLDVAMVGSIAAAAATAAALAAAEQFRFVGVRAARAALASKGAVSGVAASAAAAAAAGKGAVSDAMSDAVSASAAGSASLSGALVMGYQAAAAAAAAVRPAATTATAPMTASMAHHGGVMMLMSQDDDEEDGAWGV